MTKSPEQLENMPLPQGKQDFESQFPIERYARGTLWTKQGSPEGLRGKVRDAMEAAIKDNPTSGVVRFEKLADGGYEIKYFRSKE